MSPFPKKLDMYLMRKFLLTFLAAMVLIIVIVIIFDISEKIDYFVAKQAPLHGIIFDYYMNFIPYFVNMFSPLFVFITVIFFTSRLTANSEFIAMLSCGINFHRLMVPYMVVAGVIAAMSLSLSLWVIPQANETRLAFEKQYGRTKKQTQEQHIHYKLEGGKYVYVETFSKWNNTAYKFTLEDFEDNRLVSKLSAESAQWDSLQSCWRLKNYTVRDYAIRGLGDRVHNGKTVDTTLSLTIEDFYRNKNTVEMLSWTDLNALIDAQRERGDSMVMYAEIEKHNRLALPFSAFILTLMGVSLSTKKRRGGTGWNIAVGIALSFSYILFMRFSQMFVFTGTLPAWIALWLPNILFAIIAAVLYKIAPK